MRRILFISVIILAALAVFVGCGNGAETNHSLSTEESENIVTQTLTITFNTNGGSEIPSQKISKGEKILKPNNPEKAGYAFTGWTYQGEEWSFIGYSATTDMTLDAIWEPIVYSISYDLNGGYTNSARDYTIESENISLTEAYKNGYEFLGWTWEGQTEPQKEVVIENGSYGNRTYTANWSEPIVYTITYDLAGGTWGENTNPNLTTYTIERETITFTGTPTKPGYIFAGWSVGNIGWYSQSSIPSGSYGDKTVTAVWNAIFTVTDNSITGLTDAGKSLSSIEIPSTIDGVAITSIGVRAFSDCQNLTSITIPDSVTSIGDYAFYCCTGLTSITIPDSVTSIGECAFYWCTRLTSITIGNGVISIGKDAFSNLPISMDPKASNLESVYISDLAKWCGISFGNLKANPLFFAQKLYINGELVTDLVIPDGVTSIGNAFRDWAGLTSVTIPNSVTSIGGSAFSGCTGLKAVYIVDIAKWCGISFGDYYANPLGYAHNLYLNGELVTDLVIPDSVTSIGSYAFSGCTGLTSVTIPNSVTSIGEKAFCDCYCLVEVRNLSTLNITTGSSDYGYVGKYAKRIYKDGESYLHAADNGFIFYDDGTDVWLVKYNGTETNLTLPASYNSKQYAVNQYAFNNCTGLTSVTIGNGVTSIGSYAFSGCTSLTSVTIGNGVTSIGSYAFSGCASLTSVTIPDSVTYIGNFVFYNCADLTSITFTGTKAQWNAISKGSVWNINTGNYTIHCTDGDIAKT